MLELVEEVAGAAAVAGMMEVTGERTRMTRVTRVTRVTKETGILTSPDADVDGTVADIPLLYVKSVRRRWSRQQ